MISLNTIRSVRSKLILVVMSTVTVALCIAGAALLLYEANNYERTWFNDLSSQADLLARANGPALAFNDPRSAEEYLMLLNERQEIKAAAIYTQAGRLFASYSRDNETIQFPESPNADIMDVKDGYFMVFKRVLENNELLGTVYLQADYHLFERLQDYLLILGLVLIISLLGALLFSIWIQTVITKPILAVADVARQIQDNRNFSLRVRKTTHDEIGLLVDAFNDMLAEVVRQEQTLQATNRQLAHEIEVRREAESDLRKLNLDLEQRVHDRTAQLEDANKELEGFSYSVSHDLRAPLRAIAGYANILDRDYKPVLDDEAKGFLDRIQIQAKRMGQLIDDLLAFSRLGRKELRMDEVDMMQLTQETFNSLIQEHNGTSVDFRLGSLPETKGDQSLLAQVWTNLLSNALKFTSKEQQPVIEVDAMKQNGENIYLIRDNGDGFDPQYQDKLFGVFQRLHNDNEFPGTGVGLALVQRIVNRHGGRVWAEGVPSKGATFYFSLPRKSGQSTKSHRQ